MRPVSRPGEGKSSRGRLRRGRAPGSRRAVPRGRAAARSAGSPARVAPGRQDLVAVVGPERDLGIGPALGAPARLFRRAGRERDRPCRCRRRGGRPPRSEPSGSFATLRRWAKWMRRPKRRAIAGRSLVGCAPKRPRTEREPVGRAVMRVEHPGRRRRPSTTRGSPRMSRGGSSAWTASLMPRSSAAGTTSSRKRLKLRADFVAPETVVERRAALSARRCRSGRRRPAART